MKKTLRFTAAEMGKTLKRPVMYLMVAFLAVVMVVAALVFNPDSNKLGVENPATTIEINASLDANIAKSQALQIISAQGLGNELVSSMQSLLNFYNSPTRPSIDKVIKTGDPTTAFARLSTDYTSYMPQPGVGGGDTNVGASGALYESVKNLQNTLTVLYNATYPVLVISTVNKTRLNLELDRLEEIALSAKSILTGDIAQHNQIRQQLRDEKIFITISNIIANISDVPFDTAFFNSLQVNIIDELAARQAAILLEMNAPTATTPYIIESTRQFIDISLTAQRLFVNQLYRQAVKGKSDDQIKGLSVFNTNYFLAHGTTHNFNRQFATADIFILSLQENIVRDQYLWDEGKFSYDYSYNFSNGSLMDGQDASGFDFAFFSMEMVSFFIIVLAIILGATAISGEYSSGTMKMIAMRPYSRFKILTGKFLSTFFFTLILIVATGIIAMSVGLIVHNASMLPIMTAVNGDAVMIVSPYVMYLIYLLTLMLRAVVFISIALLISVIFKNGIAALITSLLFFLIGPFINAFSGGSSALAYIPFVNIDIFKFFGNQHFISSGNNIFFNLFSTPAIFGNSIFFSVAFVIIVIGACMGLAHSLFKARDIT